MVFLFLIGKYLLYNNVTVVLLNSVNDTTAKNSPDEAVNLYTNVIQNCNF